MYFLPLNLASVLRKSAGLLFILFPELDPECQDFLGNDTVSLILLRCLMSVYKQKASPPVFTTVGLLLLGFNLLAVCATCENMNLYVLLTYQPSFATRASHGMH